MSSSRQRKYLMKLCRGKAQPNSSQEPEEYLLDEVQQMLAFEELDPNFHVKGKTPLCEAIRCNFSEITKLLLDSGADVNMVDCNGTSPLYLAASYGNLEIVRMLCDHSANLDYRFEHYKTPLGSALINKHFTIVKVLIEAGADVNVEVQSIELISLYDNAILHIQSPLDHVLLEGKVDLADMMLDAGAKPQETHFMDLCFQFLFVKELKKMKELVKKMICLCFKPHTRDKRLMQLEDQSYPEDVVESIKFINDSLYLVPSLKVLSRTVIRTWTAKSSDRRHLFVKLKELGLPKLLIPSLCLKSYEDEFH